MFSYRLPDTENARDNAVIAHCFRNWITRTPVVHELFFSGQQIAAARKVLERLVDEEYLSKHPLWGNTSYYRLGPKAVSRWGYPRGRTGKLGVTRLPYEIAVLRLMTEKRIKRLLPHELQIRVPGFPLKLMQWAYFWCRARNALGLIRVEPRQRPERLVRNLRLQHYQYTQDPHGVIRHLDEHGQLFFVAIPATASQRLALEAVLSEDPLPVEVVIEREDCELIRFL